MKRTTLPFKGKTWMFLSSWNETVVKPVQVWNSGNFMEWTRVTDSAAFPARIIRSAVAYDGRIWIVGGKWTSSLGGRYPSCFEAMDGAAWLMQGGRFRNEPRATDVYYSRGAP